MSRQNTQNLLQALTQAQQDSGQNYLSPESIQRIAGQFSLTPEQVKDTATFYHHLSLQPRGKHILRLCSSPCCWLQGGRELAQAIQTLLGIQPGQTTDDGLFTLELCGCIGACDQSPAMLLDEQIMGNLTAQKVTDLLKKVKEGEG